MKKLMQKSQTVRDTGSGDRIIYCLYNCIITLAGLLITKKYHEHAPPDISNGGYADLVLP